jgi:hypothetical protein
MSEQHPTARGTDCYGAQVGPETQEHLRNAVARMDAVRRLVVQALNQVERFAPQASNSEGSSEQREPARYVDGGKNDG